MSPEAPAVEAPAVRKVQTRDVPTGGVLISKSRAQRFLRRFFLEARFQTVTKPEVRAEGRETWQVWCKGAYGRMTPVIEITGPATHLPTAALYESLRRIGLRATLSDTGLQIARELPKEADQNGERALHEGERSDP